MTPSLERLSEIVRLAEAKSRSKKVEVEVRQAADRLREASQKAGAAARRLREERPARLRQIEQADTDEHQLKDVLKKLAQYRAAMDPSVSAESLADAAKAEIESSRKEARAALETLSREADEARRDLRAAMDQYDQLRRELDRLQPAIAQGFAAEDKLLFEAETQFPGGLFQSLAREVEAGSPFFGMLSRPEQYAQLKIWIGRYRQCQEVGGPGEADADDAQAQAQVQRVFQTLKGLSKQYEPGYIDAFRLDFQADWPAYVQDAQAQLQQAVEAAKLAKEREQQRGVQQARDAEKLVAARESGRTALAALRALLARAHVPDEGLDEFLNLLRQCVLGLGASDPDLLDIASPYRELLEGDELRALRRNLDRSRKDEDAALAAEADTARYEDLIALTQGKTAVMIGGSPREDARRALQSLFQFDSLEWESSEDTKPAALDSLERRVRNRGLDLLVLLRSFIGHSVSERLRPACEDADVPCVLVERGYGASQVAEALKRTFQRGQKADDRDEDHGPNGRE